METDGLLKEMRVKKYKLIFSNLSNIGSKMMQGTDQERILGRLKLSYLKKAFRTFLAGTRLRLIMRIRTSGR